MKKRTRKYMAIKYILQPIMIIYSQTITSIMVGLWTYFFGSNYTDISGLNLPQWVIFIISVINSLFMFFVLLNSFRRDVIYYNYFMEYTNDEKMLLLFSINIIIQVIFFILLAFIGHMYGKIDLLMLGGYILMTLLLIVSGLLKKQDRSL